MLRSDMKKEKEKAKKKTRSKRRETYKKKSQTVTRSGGGRCIWRVRSALTCVMEATRGSR
jgi:hypothetical protein